MKRVTTGVVALHLAVTIWHGIAHEALGVLLPPEKQAFVYLVIVLAPVAGAVMLWTRYAHGGAWVLVVSMLGALLFGVYHHYLAVSADNIHHLPGGTPGIQSAFVVSAAALALLELAGVVLSVLCVHTLSVPGESPSE